jgi:tetratricopeptide repeat protein
LNIFDFFTLLSLFYVLVGVRCLYRVITRWHALWDDRLTQDDVKLASQAAFYLLVPPSVALHELGHAAVIWAEGFSVSSWMFLGYMGWVVPSGQSGPLGVFWTALAGNLVTLAIGVFALFWGLERPGHPVRNILWIELGRQSLFLVLIFYPLICLQFDGDFRKIYDFDATPIASGTVAVCHGVLLALGYGVLWKQRWKPRALLLSSPYALELVALEKRLGDDPGDAQAHRGMGLALFEAGDHGRALEHLKRAVEGGRADPKVRMALGSVLSTRGEHDAAIVELALALEGLLRPEERLLAELPLARSLLATGRRDEARALLAELIEKHPKHRQVRELYDRAR